MSLIYKQLWIRGAKDRRKVLALFDTGASESFIRPDIAYGIGVSLKLRMPFRVEFGRGTARVEEQVEAVITIDGFRIRWSYSLIPKITEELVIGTDFLQRYRIKLDPAKEKITVDPKYLKVKLVRTVYPGFLFSQLSLG